MVEKEWEELFRIVRQKYSSLPALKTDKCPDEEKIVEYALFSSPKQDPEMYNHVIECRYCFELAMDVRVANEQRKNKVTSELEKKFNKLVKERNDKEKEAHLNRKGAIVFSILRDNRFLAAAASIAILIGVNFLFERDKIVDLGTSIYEGEPVRSDTGTQYDYTTLFDTDAKIHTGIRDESLIITWDSEIDPQSIKLSDEYTGDELFSAEEITDNEITVPLNTLEIDKDYLLEIIGTLPGDIHVRFERKLKTGKKGLFF